MLCKWSGVKSPNPTAWFYEEAWLKGRVECPCGRFVFLLRNGKIRKHDIDPSWTECPRTYKAWRKYERLTPDYFRERWDRESVLGVELPTEDGWYVPGHLNDLSSMYQGSTVFIREGGEWSSNITPVAADVYAGYIQRVWGLVPVGTTEPVFRDDRFLNKMVPWMPLSIRPGLYGSDTYNVPHEPGLMATFTLPKVKGL